MNGDTPRHPNSTVAPQDDYPREACGIVGIYSEGEDVARYAFFGLYALQHRGQESAGIASSTGDGINLRVSMGLVGQAFQEEDIAQLPGHIAIGHTRYSYNRQQRNQQRPANFALSARLSILRSRTTATSLTP